MLETTRPSSFLIKRQVSVWWGESWEVTCPKCCSPSSSCLSCLQFERELDAIRQQHDILQESTDKRDRLSQAIRAKLEERCRRTEQSNKQLKGGHFFACLFVCLCVVAVLVLFCCHYEGRYGLWSDWGRPCLMWLREEFGIAPERLSSLVRLGHVYIFWSATNKYTVKWIRKWLQWVLFCWERGRGRGRKEREKERNKDKRNRQTKMWEIWRISSALARKVSFAPLFFPCAITNLIVHVNLLHLSWLSPPSAQLEDERRLTSSSNLQAS